MVILHRSGLYGAVGTQAELSRAVHVISVLLIGATVDQILISGPVLSATFILFLVTVISVFILQMKKSMAVVTPLIVVTTLGIVVQVVRAYHYRAISFGSIVVIVALAWALRRIVCVASFLKNGS